VAEENTNNSDFCSTKNNKGKKNKLHFACTQLDVYIHTVLKGAAQDSEM
jgi:hypothetical protein